MMTKEQKLSILQYARERAELVGGIIGYYDTLENQKYTLTLDEQLSQSIATARLYEIEGFIRHLETLEIDKPKTARKGRKKKSVKEDEPGE